MKKKVQRQIKQGIRYTLAYYAGNAALTSYCPLRLKENTAFLREFVRLGHSREALGCMVENIFLGDPNDFRHAAVIKWYDRRHPGCAALIVGYLEELVSNDGFQPVVRRIRKRLKLHHNENHKKPSNYLRKIIGR